MREIKQLAEADFENFVTIVANAYPGMSVVSAEDKERARQRFLQSHQQDPSVDFYGLYEDGRLVGGMRLHDFTMTVLSTQVKAGGIGELAVDLLRKKEKGAHDMMLYFLRHCLEMGASMALLYPFRPDFYKRMGFGYGTKLNQYRVKPASLPRGPSKVHVHMLRPEDKSALLACHNRVAAQTHGMLQRSIFEADRLFASLKARLVGYKKDGEILGYLVFTFERDKQDNWLLNDILVREFIYETQEARSELLTFLHTQLDQVNTVIFHLYDEDFHYLPFDPRDGTDNLIGPVHHQSNTQGVGLMYRVLDTRKVFQVLREHNFGGQDCRLKLSIRDTFLPENDGSTIIHFEGGKPHLKKDDDFEVEVRLDVSDFSSLLMGTVRFRTLHRYGLAEISDPSYVDTINTIFGVAEKPVCTTLF